VRVVIRVFKRTIIAPDAFLSGVTVLAAPPRVHPRIPGIGTIRHATGTVETSHGIYRVVFLVVPTLTDAIPGDDGVEVKLEVELVALIATASWNTVPGR
jgi:hypothetical protein